MSDQYWLVKLDVHGNPTLKDGPHQDVSGVQKALYLFNSLGFVREDDQFGCARISISSVVADGSDVNHEAIAILNSAASTPNPSP
ncbi:hypothetical protein [Pseudomonas aeruginosa]|uniref:hypothetical protein n=1 Tax=Pseudomonas aeruginosa TaxID=287 RepID=UPI003CFF5024